MIAADILNIDNDQIEVIDVDSEENLVEACHRVENVGMTISFNSYYSSCSEMMFANEHFPFIINKGVVKWNEPFSNVTVAQFLETHTDALINGIKFEHGYVAAGGAGWIEAKNIIVQWAPLLWQSAVMFGEAYGIFKSAKSIIAWFENKYKDNSKMPYPHSYTDFIYRKAIWNHHELAVLLDCETEQAKMFLKAYGYKWDTQKQAYVVDEKVKLDFIEKENKIEYLYY